MSDCQWDATANTTEWETTNSIKISLVTAEEITGIHVNEWLICIFDTDSDEQLVTVYLL